MEYQGSNELSHEDRINADIRNLKVDTNKISDGYHSFGELYEHRIQLWITLCREVSNRMRNDIGGYSLDELPWRTQVHSDGSSWDGWFVLGMSYPQMTYHLPMSKWKECEFAYTVKQAPEWDGHTSADVLERLKDL